MNEGDWQGCSYKNNNATTIDTIFVTTIMYTLIRGGAHGWKTCSKAMMGSMEDAVVTNIDATIAGVATIDAILVVQITDALIGWVSWHNGVGWMYVGMVEVCKEKRVGY